jgi:hypothetical protein
VGEVAANSGFYAFEEISRMSVEELRLVFREIKDNLFFRLLQIAGPAKLVAMLQQREPELELRNHFNSDCDACLELNRNLEAGPALHALLTEYADSLRRTLPLENEP